MGHVGHYKTASPQRGEDVTIPYTVSTTSLAITKMLPVLRLQGEQTNRVKRYALLCSEDESRHKHCAGTGILATTTKKLEYNGK